MKRSPSNKSTWVGHIDGGTPPAGLMQAPLKLAKKVVPSPQPPAVPEKKGIVPADLIATPRPKSDRPQQKPVKK
jgi:hypothetical protein